LIAVTEVGREIEVRNLQSWKALSLMADIDVGIVIDRRVEAAKTLLPIPVTVVGIKMAWILHPVNA